MADKWEIHKYSEGGYYWVKTKNGTFSGASTEPFKEKDACTQDAIKNGMADPSKEIEG